MKHREFLPHIHKSCGNCTGRFHLTQSMLSEDIPAGDAHGREGKTVHLAMQMTSCNTKTAMAWCRNWAFQEISVPLMIHPPHLPDTLHAPFFLLSLEKRRRTSVQATSLHWFAYLHRRDISETLTLFNFITR